MILKSNTSLFKLFRTMCRAAYSFIIVFCIAISTMQAQQTISENIMVDGVMREYIVYVPAQYDGKSPVPLMFNFHGFGGQAEGHMNGSNMRPVADTTGFILIYPQGTLFFGTPHWNVGSWTNGSTANDLGFTEAMIDTLASQYNIDQNRVYSCGYSNGGYFSFELACQLSDRVAAIGAVGGKMSSETYNACNPSHPVPVVTIHGTADNVVGYHNSQPFGSKTIPEVNAYWVNFNLTEKDPIIKNMADNNTSDGSTVEYSSYKSGSQCTTVDHYKVIGGGHDWPGVTGNQDIDASSVIWNFVSKYDLNGLIDCQTTSVKTGSQNENVFVIYPNPARDIVTIEIELFQEKMLCQVYSITGQLILSQNFSTNKETLDISSLPLGVYYIEIGGLINKLIKS